MKRRNLLKGIFGGAVIGALPKLNDIPINIEPEIKPTEPEEIKIKKFRNGDVVSADDINGNFEAIKEAIQSPRTFSSATLPAYGITAASRHFTNFNYTTSSSLSHISNTMSSWGRR